ncbi:MAG: hypothetical protein L0H64_17400 [Pseudonocardia sp.]|nr:hypothetical protein [Pseudonocardia sp.]
MAYTPPVPGSPDWDTPLNQALADIDATAEAAQDAASDALAGGGATVAALQTTASTSFTDLATVGPSTSVTLASPRTVLVFLTARMRNQTTSDDVYQSFAAAGATVVAAADGNGTRHNGSGASQNYSSVSAVACSAGTTTFTAKYRVDGGTGEFTDRVIGVVVT